jgi:small subunit ribosomal protein S2
MRDMSQLPGALFVIDPKREHLAIDEARRLRIPIIAVTDTNCDPDDVDLIVPGNDDAIRAVRLLTAGIAEAAIQGMMRSEIAEAERFMDMGAADEEPEMPDEPELAGVAAGGEDEPV